MNESASPIRFGESLRIFEAIDARLRSWALAQGAVERRFPVLIGAATLRRAEYPEAFPHLLMAPAVAADPGQPFGDGNSRICESFRSPAVCYHAYAAPTGQTVEQGLLLTARG